MSLGFVQRAVLGRMGRILQKLSGEPSTGFSTMVSQPLMSCYVLKQMS